MLNRDAKIRYYRRSVASTDEEGTGVSKDAVHVLYQLVRRPDLCSCPKRCKIRRCATQCLLRPVRKSSQEMLEQRSFFVHGESVPSSRKHSAIVRVIRVRYYETWWLVLRSGNDGRVKRQSNADSLDRGSRDSETVVGVFELRRNTRAGCRATGLDVMPPGATSRGATAAVGRSLRISCGRVTIVAGVIPIPTPFMHVVAQIVEAVAVWRIQTYRFRAPLPAQRVIGK